MLPALRTAAPTRFDRLFTKLVAPRPAFIRGGDARGTEHIGPEDTMEADYGRLLERAQDLVDKGNKRDSNPQGLVILP